MKMFLPNIIFSRIALMACIAIGLLGLSAERSQGATVHLTDASSGDIITIPNIPANTTLSFTLALGAPPTDVFGSLAFDVRRSDGTFASLVSFLGFPSNAGSRNYGTLNDDNAGLDLFDQVQWQVDLGPLPIGSITVVFDNSAFRLSGGDLNATLTVVGADIPVGETPLPAALPLFAGGLSTIALMARRRRRRRVDVAATVPCLRFEAMSPAKKRAYLIADNKLALNAGWDEELLADELKELCQRTLISTSA